MVRKKGRQKNKCSSVTGRFNGCASALEQYRWHCLMRHVQGYPESHWTPPLGNYSLRIAPVTARAKAIKMTTKNGPTFLAILPQQCAGTISHASTDRRGLGLC
jgi:hypothetical protein